MRIQSKIIRKRYKPNQPPSIYVQNLVPVPLSENDGLRPFLKQELHFSKTVDDDTLTIYLRKEKASSELK